MNPEEKRDYLEGYRRAKESGAPFFPEVVFKDMLVSLVVFTLLVVLARFVGAPLEARANPADTGYTPRPEWYFMFLFQLLKYFPGSLEVIGVSVLPTLAILGLFALPYLDRGPRRHWLRRPAVTVGVGVVLAAIVGLSVRAVVEAPPPAQAAAPAGDQAARLYATDCAGCHGDAIQVAAGTDLHRIIAQGGHTGMPAWGGDLSSDEIDALAGFIVSPRGSALFAAQCGKCHTNPLLASGEPLQLKQALDQGPDYPAHAGLNVPAWSETLTKEERISLLNFLAAPDGEQLFAVNCSPCHGRAVAFGGDEAQLRQIIQLGGLHLQMPPWRGKLSATDLDTLARYVVDPASAPGGASLFQRECARCHGGRVPAAASQAAARELISSGGPHQTMPVWGDVLTPQQLDALVSYTLQTARGAPATVGRELFGSNCAPCHGQFGEGGPNPGHPGYIISPISSAQFLSTRDDATLRAIISAGQPDSGMSPFGVANGGPLDDDQIDAIVAFLRSWTDQPPVELPPEVPSAPPTLSGAQVYASVCSRCHGTQGEGGVGPALRDPAFQSRYSDQALFAVISQGHAATPMIAWGALLTSEQIRELVTVVHGLAKPPATAPTPTPTLPSEPSFAQQVLPILQQSCAACHGSLGGWSASSYADVMGSGDHKPVVIAGDAVNSLLAQKLLGTQTQGSRMPPSGVLPQESIQVILDWIASGAPDN